VRSDGKRARGKRKGGRSGRLQSPALILEFKESIEAG
jgi:hypothetical protein